MLRRWRKLWSWEVVWDEMRNSWESRIECGLHIVETYYDRNLLVPNAGYIRFSNVPWK